MEEHKRRLVLSAEAEADLFSIWTYGADEWSPIVADEHERIVWRACERLLENNELGRTRDELMHGLRSVLVEPHVVFYRIAPIAIEIVRVVHQHEDIETVFH